MSTEFIARQQLQFVAWFEIATHVAESVDRPVVRRRSFKFSNPKFWQLSNDLKDATRIQSDRQTILTDNIYLNDDPSCYCSLNISSNPPAVVVRFPHLSIILVPPLSSIEGNIPTLLIQMPYLTRATCGCPTSRRFLRHRNFTTFTPIDSIPLLMIS